MRRCAVGVVIAAAAMLAAVPALAEIPEGSVVRLDLTGPVDPLAARYIERALIAPSDRSVPQALAIIRIDTPGGLDSSMRSIVKAIANAGGAVVCWVGPAGSRAASAGAFVLTGCPIAAMAPGTNVGAAHPVGIQGEILSEKVTNDAAAYIRSLAQRWGRNADLAERMVRESVSVSAEEALDAGAIDLIARDEHDLLDRIEGRRIEVSGCAAGSGPAPDRDGTVPADAPPARTGSCFATFGEAAFDERTPVHVVEMSLVESFLHSAVDPNLAFLLLTLGLLGIASEVLHPGITVGGVFGGLALIASLVILGMLPVNLAGLLLVLAGIALLVAEAYLPGGIAGAVGLVALVLGGLFLFDSSVPGAQVSRALLIAVVLVVAAFFFVLVRATMRSRRQVPSTPTTAELIGIEGTVERALDPVGIVRARNEEWTAQSTAGPLPAGARVRVVRVEGLTLEVEPATVLSEAGMEGES